MARRYVNPNRVQLSEVPRPGSWAASLNDSTAPGATLSGTSWAASWSRFLRSLSDETVQSFLRNAAMSERIPSEGGFLVPENLRAELITLAIEQAIVRPRARVFPMTSLRLGVPVLDNMGQAGTAGALGGLTFGMVPEGTAIPASGGTFMRAVLEARKFAALLQGVPNELIEDAGPAFEAFIGPAIAAGWAFYEDDLFINGNPGQGQPEGLLNASCAIAVTRTTASEVQLADVAALRKRIHPAAIQRRTAVWLASSEVVGQLAELSATAAGTDGASATTVPVGPTSGMGLSVAPDGGWRLAGLDLIETGHLPALGTAGDLVAADFSAFAIGDRRAMTVERSQRGAGFTTDTSDFKITGRLDGRWLLRAPVTPENGETVSAVVILN